MLEHTSGGWQDVHGSEGFLFCGTIREEGIRIDVCDLVLKWYPPKFKTWRAPAFEDGGFGNCDLDGLAVVDGDLVAVAYGNISEISKLAATE